ncbi:uncharacterized protein LOC143898010 [Temnothorax americanus]|uniref:uncharacterized protein LOC143898010 n=1 Tax=Temnothorax americanus TaxID=1964332 RepID=UPI0040687A49
MERLLAEQQDVIRSIERTIENYKKMAMKLRTPAVTRSRLVILKERWTQCQTLNAEIKTAATTEQRTALPYFVEDEFSAAEDTYLEAADFLAQALDEMEKPVTTYSHNIHSSTISESNPVAIPLPRINLPKFSGQYTEWTNFRDLFESLVASNENLSNVQRLHYLKASLTAEAALVIKNISITDANYRTAWSELQRRYDNLRAIVTAHLNSILDLPSMKSESASELKRVYDTINDSLHALRNIGRRVDDDFVVAITVRKLDSRTLREWELQLGSANNPPLYSTLSEFLVGKMRALEAISDVRNDSNSKNPRTGTTKSLVSNVSHKCMACQEPHDLYQCSKFKSFSVDQRKNLVKTQRCCYNCLGRGHFPSTCPSQKRCTHCQGKHHSLLHYGNEPNSSKELETSKANDSKSDVPVSEPNSTVALKVQIERVSNPITTPVLLATARVLVRTTEGRALRIRALIDTGSEATFITERAAQALHSKRQKTKVRVTGLGGRCSNVSNYRTFITLSPCSSEFYHVNTRALILPTLTSYKQMPKVDHELFPHLRDLQLADADPSNQDRIDLLIGADIYGSILLEGLRKGSETEPVAQRTIFGWVIFGPYSSIRNVDKTTSLHATVSPSVDDKLRKFWELEEIPFTRPLTKEEEYCENLFVSSHYRRPDGRYVVRLPFKGDAVTEFGNSLQIAVKSLIRLENRLSRDPALHEAYNRFLNEYEQLGHMSRITPSDQNGSSTFYMPHHPVLREANSSTPL